MKKNFMMRAASVLLVAVMLTTCAISGTFAKYVTSNSGSDIARVAKFGVKVDANGDLFLHQYETTDKTEYNGDNSVQSGNTWKVVAPGTSGSIDEVVITGKPEVAVKISYDATLTLDGWVLSDGNEYCPVYFTIEGKTYGTDDSGLGFDYTYATVSELVAGVEAAIEACVKTYDPLTDLSTVSDDFPSVTWTWAFETSDANDIKDTDLGDKAAAGNHAVIKLDVETTVTQID